MQGMPSFSLTMLPSFESATAMVSLSTFFLRNFFKPAHQLRHQNRDTGHLQVCSPSLLLMQSGH